MMPRSVPVTAKFATVLFGLSGPVTQPTTEVPGGRSPGAATATDGAGSGATGAGTAAALGLGTVATPACCCTAAVLGLSTEARI